MSDSTHASIMVIGGDSDFRYLMQRYVSTGAHKIVFAHLAEDVLALAQREKPTAIVLEVESPATLGWQVLRALKVDQVTESIPVMLCSWLDEESRAREEGAEVYLRMPILYDDFKAALTHLGIG